MPKIDYKAAYERAQIERWLAPNAYMFVPPDFEKRYPPGKAPLWMTIAMEKAPRRPQSTYRYVDGAEPINHLAPVSSAEKSQALHAQALRLPLSAHSGLKYSPDQPRVPAGQPGGGQWAGGNGGGASDDVTQPAQELDRRPKVQLSALIISVCIPSGITRWQDDYGNKGWKAVFECAGGISFERRGTGRAPGLILDPFVRR